MNALVIMPERNLSPGLWSLWDMINFHFASTVEFVTKLEVRRLRFKEIIESGKGSLTLSNADGRSIQEAIEVAEVVFKEIDNKNIQFALGELRKSVGYARNNAQIYADICSLFQAMQVTFRQMLFYSYPPSKGEVFGKWKIEWELVYKAFPETVEDIWHGVDCWAMGQDTASGRTIGNCPLRNFGGAVPPAIRRLRSYRRVHVTV